MKCAVFLPVMTLAMACGAQTTGPQQAAPIAIVPLDSNAKPGEAATVTGALEVSSGRAMIAASGTVTAGSRTTRVLLPRRGELLVCARTEVKLAADGAVQGDAPGLLLALSHGAMELSLAGSHGAHNADVLMTPDFRILVSGPGSAEVKVRLGQQGDTCIDNVGASAPYVLVSSLFEGGAYRVQPGQRVSFQHGSLHTVVDQEKESCGCPPERRGSNEFPLAQSEGLEPLAAPTPSREGALTVEPLRHEGGEMDAKTKPVKAAEPQVAQQPAQQKPEKKPGIFSRMGAFFRKIFGAE
jgi:hypothetical protein